MANNDHYREDYAEPSGLDDLGSEHWLPWWADVLMFLGMVLIASGIGVAIDRGILH